ncbi:MAG: type II toxin-antitoxin system RelE/ParE family toxin [Mariprofundaceae bacterium]
MNFSLKIKSSALKELKRINKPERKRIIHAIEQLPASPWLGKSLKGELSGLRRIRIGDYRVVYEIHDQQVLVLVVRIAHRKDVYR